MDANAQIEKHTRGQLGKIFAKDKVWTFFHILAALNQLAPCEGDFTPQKNLLNLLGGRTGQTIAQLEKLLSKGLIEKIERPNGGIGAPEFAWRINQNGFLERYGVSINELYALACALPKIQDIGVISYSSVCSIYGRMKNTNFQKQLDKTLGFDCFS